MTAWISLPLATYLGFLGRCILSGREFALLKNSVVERAAHAPRGTIIVELLCTLEDAELLLDRASRFYPTAVPYIEEAVRRSRQDDTATSVSEFACEYRRPTSGDTWHICSNCVHWPVDDFVSVRDLPCSAQLCNECRVKQGHGSCTRARLSDDSA